MTSWRDCLRGVGRRVDELRNTCIYIVRLSKFSSISLSQHRLSCLSGSIIGDLCLREIAVNLSCLHHLLFFLLSYNPFQHEICCWSLRNILFFLFNLKSLIFYSIDYQKQNCRYLWILCWLLDFIKKICKLVKMWENKRFQRKQSDKSEWLWYKNEGTGDWRNWSLQRFLQIVGHNR